MPKSPQINEVLPLLYLHGLSSSDFVPALQQFLGTSSGLSAPVITRLTVQWAGRGPSLRRPGSVRRRLRLPVGRRRAPARKFVEAVAKVIDDLLAFYNFPAEHWVHLRTTNPIESTFATVRHRTKVTNGPGSKAAGLAMAIKLIEAAQQRWRALNAPHVVAFGPYRRPLRARQTRRASPTGGRMIITLCPPKAAGPLRISATGQQAVDTLRTLGDPRVLCRLPGSRSGWAVDRPSGLFISAYFDTDDRVEAIEFGRGHDNTADPVTYNGLNVFATPATELVTQLRHHTTVRKDEDGHAFTAPDLLLTFRRPTAPETPDDQDGRFFTSVLLARPGYYNDLNDES